MTESALVDVGWLFRQIGDEKLVVLDASVPPVVPGFEPRHGGTRARRSPFPGSSTSPLPSPQAATQLASGPASRAQDSDRSSSAGSHLRS